MAIKNPAEPKRVKPGDLDGPLIVITPCYYSDRNKANHHEFQCLVSQGSHGIRPFEKKWPR